MVFSNSTLVTKPCPDCVLGREGVMYVMDKYTRQEAAEAFKKSPEYDATATYLIDGNADTSLVWHVRKLS